MYLLVGCFSFQFQTFKHLEGLPALHPSPLNTSHLFFLKLFISFMYNLEFFKKQA